MENVFLEEKVEVIFVVEFRRKVKLCLILIGESISILLVHKQYGKVKHLVFIRSVKYPAGG